MLFIYTQEKRNDTKYVRFVLFYKIILVCQVKEKRLGYVAHVGEMRTAYNILV